MAGQESGAVLSRWQAPVNTSTPPSARHQSRWSDCGSHAWEEPGTATWPLHQTRADAAQPDPDAQGEEGPTNQGHPKGAIPTVAWQPRCHQRLLKMAFSIYSRSVPGTTALPPGDQNPAPSQLPWGEGTLGWVCPLLPQSELVINF